MKTPLIYIKSSGDGISEALSATEKLGAESGLSDRSVLRLRLLAEELTGLLRGIAGDVGASYRAEGENGSFELRLRSEVEMTDEMRSRFISASSDGENRSARGVTGKIRMMIAGILLALNETDKVSIPADTVTAMPIIGDAGETAFLWSMASYRPGQVRGVGRAREISACQTRGRCQGQHRGEKGRDHGLQEI